MVFDPEKISLIVAGAKVTGYADGSKVSAEHNSAVIVRHHQRLPVVALESDRIGLGSFVRPVVVLRTSDESYRSRSQQSQKYSFFHNLLLFNKLYVSSCTKDRRKAYASGAHGNTGSGKID